MKTSTGKKLGRPRVLTDRQRTEYKTRYNLNKAWICPICEPERNYTLAGKHSHMQTKKHQKNKKQYSQAIVIDSENNVRLENM